MNQSFTPVWNYYSNIYSLPYAYYVQPTTYQSQIPINLIYIHPSNQNHQTENLVNNQCKKIPLEPQNPPIVNQSRVQPQKNTKKQCEILELIEESEQSQGYNPNYTYQKTKYINKNKPKIKLNKNRNVKQSLVQQFFSFLHNQRKSKVFVQKIMEELNVKVTQKMVGNYYIYFKNMKANLEKSLKQKNLMLLRPLQMKTSNSIKQLTEQQKNIELFKNISRRLAFYFYSVLLPIRVITSKKLRKSNDYEMIQSNLIMRREILKSLNQWFSQ